MLLGYAGDGVCVADAADHVVDVNDRFCEILRRPREELLGLTIRELANSDEASDDGELPGCADEGLTANRRRFRRGDGSWLTAEIVACALVDGTRVAILRDLAEPSAVPTVLQDRSQHLSTLVHEAADAIITMDDAGVLLSMNPAAERLFGYRAAEVIGGVVGVLMPDSDAIAHAGSLARYLRTGERRIIGVTREVEGRHRDGSHLPLDLRVTETLLAGGRRLFTGTLHDLRDRKRVQAALEHSDRLARELTALAPGVFYLFDLDERRNVYVNRSPAQLLGYRAEEMPHLGEGFLSEVLHPDDSAVVADHLQRAALLDDGVSVTVEYRFRHQDGSWRWFHSRDTVFARHPDGRARQLLGVATDITERKHAEEGLREREAQLRSVFSSIDEGFSLCEMIVDDNGTPIDYRFLTVNPLFEEMTGLVDATGRTARELVPNLEQIWVENYARVALEGQTVRFEQGSEVMGRWFDVFAMPLAPRGRFAIVFKDDTQRHRAALALQEVAALDHFRAGFNDGLRTLTDPIQIQAEAARLLGEYLAASRVHYAEVSDDARFGIVHAQYQSDPSVVSVVGRHDFDDYGPTVMNGFREGRTVIVHDVENDPRLTPEEREATFQLAVRSYVMVPLIKAGRPVALLVAHQAVAHLWTANEVTLIEETADRTWDAVERARVEQTLRESEARERHGRQRAELVAELLSDLEAVEGIPAKARQLVTFLTKHLADFAILEAPGNPPTVIAEAHRSAERLEAAEPPGHRTAVPIALGPDTIGTLVAGFLEDARTAQFTSSDLALLREIADRAGLLLTRARLREEERSISLRLQRALLPDTLATHPDLVISAHYEAAGSLLEVGGDWYDTYSWPDGHIGVMVGDVVGHDLHAAAAMGRLRAGVGALVTQLPPSPAAVLAALDRCANGADGTSFVTAAAVVIDPATGRVQYASAGHPPLLLIPPDGEARWLEDALSPPAGADHPPGRPERTVVLAPGAVLLMYSDGLIERRSEALDLGMARLRQVAVVLARSNEEQLARRVAADMSAERPTEDDVVVVAIRYRPGASG